MSVSAFSEFLHPLNGHYHNGAALLALDVFPNPHLRLAVCLHLQLCHVTGTSACLLKEAQITRSRCQMAVVCNFDDTHTKNSCLFCLGFFNRNFCLTIFSQIVQQRSPGGHVREIHPFLDSGRRPALHREARCEFLDLFFFFFFPSTMFFFLQARWEFTVLWLVQLAFLQTTEF